jgi:hypothetical protein
MEVILPPEMRHSSPRCSGGLGDVLDDIRTGPAYPSRGRRHVQPSRPGLNWPKSFRKTLRNRSDPK